jgi:Flp pilus assembly protein TadD
MRTLRILCLLLCCGIACSLSAQTPQPGGLRCMVQPMPVPTDADRAFSSGDAKRAESLYAAQLAGSATLANYAGVVRIQLDQSKLREALATAQDAVAANPTSAAAHSLVGDVLLRSGHIPDATAAFSKALTIDPCFARAQFGISRVGELLSRHTSATRKLEIAHKLAPQDPEITAAFQTTLPAPQRAAVLHALLASGPLLSPAAITDLTEQLAIIEQHKSCSVSQPFSSASIELDPVMFSGRVPRSWGVKVQMNGGSAPLFELDPGVSGIVLDTKAAEHAGIHPLIAQPAKAGESYRGVADNVRIGSNEYHDCPVTVVPSSALDEHNGLIGVDFFKDHLIHIDYVSKAMTLDPLPALSVSGTQESTDESVAPEERDWTPVYIAGSNILLSTFINKRGPFLFLLDPGIFSTVISPPVAASELDATEDRTYNLAGSSGKIIKVMPREGLSDLDGSLIHDSSGKLLVLSRARKNAAYQFAGNDYGDLKPVSYDISAKSQDAGIEISGLLGFGVLQNYSLDINYRDGLVRILYDKNRRYWARYVEKQY